jgi:hypothetical protein
MKEGGVLDLARVADDLAAGPLGLETEHQRMGNGHGWLVAHVADDAKSGLLEDLGAGLLGALAGIHETGQHARRPAGSDGAPEEDLLAALDGHDHHRRDARKVLAPQASLLQWRTMARATVLGGRAAAAAEAVGAIPFEHLQRPRQGRAGRGGRLS